MFGKKKKRLEISGPSNFEHRVHTGFDHREQKFTGLPQQWHSLLADTANRPKPMVDPSCITPIQLAPMKVLYKVFLSCCLWSSLPIFNCIVEAVHELSPKMPVSALRRYLLHDGELLLGTSSSNFCMELHLSERLPANCDVTTSVYLLCPHC